MELLSSMGARSPVLEPTCPHDLLSELLKVKLIVPTFEASSKPSPPQALNAVTRSESCNGSCLHYDSGADCKVTAASLRRFPDHDVERL